MERSMVPKQKKIAFHDANTMTNIVDDIDGIKKKKHPQVGIGIR